MKVLLHKILLYISIYIICASAFSFVVCGLAFLFGNVSQETESILQIASYILAAIFVILFVRCRPLNSQEKEDPHYFRFHFQP